MKALSKNAETLEKALIYLKNQDSGFTIMEVNDAALQRRALDHFRSHLPENEFRTVDLKRSHPDHSPLYSIREAVKAAPDARVFFILDFHSLADGGDEGEKRLVRQLNFNREAYSDLNRVLVFFLKDFFDFAPVLFSLTEVTADLQWQSLEDEFVDPEFLKNRVAFLETYIDSLEPFDSKRAETLEESADCIGRLFEFEYDVGISRKALDYLQQSLSIRREKGDRSGESKVLNNIGQLFQARGEYEKALDVLQQSLQIAREIDNQFNEGKALNNIGQILIAIGDYEKAQEYLFNGLLIALETKDRSGEAETLNNIAQIFQFRADNEKALDALQQSLQIFRDIGNPYGEATALNNIGQIFKEK